MKKKLTLKDEGMFTWGFSDEFFIETDKGNFVWSNPDYQGNNTIAQYNGDLEDWYEEAGIDFGRDKGNHTIEGYCGKDVKILEEK